MVDAEVIAAIIVVAGTMATAVLGFAIAWMQVVTRREQREQHDLSAKFLSDFEKRHRDAEKVLADVNDAVNHRHERGDGKKMYDIAMETHADVRLMRSDISELQKHAVEMLVWKRGYDGGPLDTGSKVHEFVQATRLSIDEIKERLRDLPCRYTPIECNEDGE